MFTRLTPYATAAADQPIFRLETRHLRWGANPDALLQNSLRRVTKIITAISVSWIILILIVAALSPTEDRTENVYTVTNGAIGVLILVGTLGSLLIDFVSVTSALTSINGELLNGRWDLLKLANIREGHFTVAKHGIAQLRAWKRMIDIIAVRLSVGVLILGFLLMLRLSSLYSAWSLLEVIPFLAILGGLQVAYSLEALWRMRTMTAVGLMVSAYTRSPITSPLTALGLMLGIWAVELTIVVAVGCGIVGLIFPILMFGGELCIVPLGIIGVIVGLYAFYEILKQYCLRRVAFRLASLESAP
ncbi:MAG: hypothetical protein U0670_04415 [Anaerolineae bacterium]